jgi:hypothetical protein
VAAQAFAVSEQCGMLAPGRHGRISDSHPVRLACGLTQWTRCTTARRGEGRFAAALQLLGEAAACLPLGVPAPVVRGPTAVELYTGSMWQYGSLELLTAEARPFISELFAVGFRWIPCARNEPGAVAVE